MASFGQLYSAYFKASDFSEGPRTFTIVKVQPERVGRDDDKDKLVVYVKEDERGITLNKTRYTALVDIFEDEDVDKWVGGTIICVPSKTKFQGRIVASYDIEGG